MKCCTGCDTEKELFEFWYSMRLSRHVSECNSCRRARAKRYRDANKERIATTNRRWQKANPDKTRAAHHRWVAKNPGIANKRTANWRKNHYQRALRKQRECNQKLKYAAYAAYGGFECACCGETTEAFLSIDHIANDGAEHRRQVDRRKIYKWMARNDYPNGFQVLCMNCNFGKARNGGVCPHQTQTSEGSTTIPKGSTLQAIGSGSAGLLSNLG